MTAPIRTTLNFEYDPAEAVHGRTFLTPVYFNRQLLVRYMYDSRFTCEFASDTYGTVYGPDFYISFGINKNQTVFAWLGDIEKLPIRERFYWLVENKAPEHEVASEFYDGQIDVVYTDPPAVITCLNNLAKFNAKFHQKFSVHLYHERSLEERIEETRRYKRLLMNNADDFKRFVSEFNEIINESANNADVRRLLDAQKVPVPSGSKGNKLLQLVYESVLGDTENLVAPFFYLYDLRLWADHAMGDGLLNDVALKLKVPPLDYQQLMEGLVSAIAESTRKLLAKVDP